MKMVTPTPLRGGGGGGGGESCLFMFVWPWTPSWSLSLSIKDWREQKMQTLGGKSKIERRRQGGDGKF